MMDYIAHNQSAPPRPSFSDGIKCPYRGIAYMADHPHLWLYGITPVLLNLLITALVLTSLVVTMTWVFTEMLPWFYQGWSERWQWFGWALAIAVALMIFSLCLVTAVIVWKLLSAVLCGFFYGKLAEQVERSLGMTKDELRSISFFSELVDALIDVGSLLLMWLMLLLVGFLPIVGAPIGLLASTLWSWYLSGYDYLSYPLSVRGMRRKQRHQFTWQHKKVTIGLGAAVVLFELIPVLGAVMLVPTTVGAVLLHRKITAAS